MQEATPSNSSTSPSLSALIAHAKAYGFLYPSSEIYDGLQAVYDYGPYGIALKRNLQAFWWRSMTQLHQNIVGLDTAIFMHPRTWQASGHMEGFHDPMIDNKDSQKRYRVDSLIEAHVARLAQEGQSQEASALQARMETLMQAKDWEGLRELVLEVGIVCPVSQTANWSEVRQFNLMFATQVGALEEASHTLYLRPETAQGSYVNFLQVQKATRLKVPFGIAQIGKAFRNEIVARQFIFRMREFEQMELQFFIPPDADEHWMQRWQAKRLLWHQVLGIPKHKLHLKAHTQLAHYAKAAVDIEYDFPFGRKEVEGIHARGDFDLQRHQQYSGKKLQYFDPHTQQHYLPHVIEASLGCDRLMLMLLAEGLKKEVLEEGKERTYLQLPPAVAPIQAAVLPLARKDGLAERAQALWQKWQYDFSLAYEDGPSIGKRYARQDLIGTPYCVTVDHQTLADDTVTVRERDSMAQARMPIERVASYLAERVSLSTLLQQMNQGN